MTDTICTRTDALFAPMGGQESISLDRLLATWAFRWRSRRELTALTDVELTDIGLDRTDALREAAKPFWRA